MHLENSTFAQLYSLFIFAISGIIIGLFFDIFRVLRRSFKTSDLITYVEDIIFWICTGLFILLVLFKFSNGQIRSYTIIGLALGVIIYILTISKYFIKINVKIVTFIKGIVLKISKLILIPIKKVLKLLRKIFFKPISFLIINIRKNIANFYKETQNFIKSNKNFSKKINKNESKMKKFRKKYNNRRILKKNVEKYN